MKYTIEIIEICLTDTNGWKYIVTKNGKNQYESYGFDSIENATEAGRKTLLGLLSETHDFGSGPVPAHQHENGDGWVANTAHVDDTVYVGPNAQVFGNARVCGYVRIVNNAKVYENAYVDDTSKICEKARIYGNAKIYGNSVIGGLVKVCGSVTFSGQTSVFGRNFLWRA